MDLSLCIVKSQDILRLYNTATKNHNKGNK